LRALVFNTLGFLFIEMALGLVLMPKEELIDFCYGV